MSDRDDGSRTVQTHFYRAVVAHMDVWRMRMDATTNWAAATTAVMVTFTFGSEDAPHFVLLLAFAFNAIFLLMESRRYQTFDLWRRRFRILNRHLIVPALIGTGDAADTEVRRAAFGGLAEELGSMVPHLQLREAVGYRIRRNYLYLFGVSVLAWTLKLEVHPAPSASLGELVARAAVGSLPGSLVLALAGAVMVGLVVLAVRAPTERMVDWEELPTPLDRWVRGSAFWRRWNREARESEEVSEEAGDASGRGAGAPPPGGEQGGAP